MCGTESTTSASGCYVIVSGTGWASNWFDSSFTNFTVAIADDIEEGKRYYAMLRQRCREAIAHLVDWHSKVLKPWLLIAKRFDFRSAPRWSANRWKSKT